MGKGGGSSQTTQLDPQTKAYMGQVYGAALAAAGLGPGSGGGAAPAGQQQPGGFPGMFNNPAIFANAGGAPTFGSAINGPAAQPVPGLSPLTQGAIGFFQNGQNAGNLGLGALTGDASAYSQLANPYQQNVIDAMKNQWGDLAQRTTNNVNDQATRAGAFGGSRHGVAEGVALGQLNKDQANQMAALNYQGFNDTMQRAQGLAGFGASSASALNQLGEYQRQVAMQQDPAMRRLEILKSAMGGPAGSTVSQSTTSNPAGGLLGGAATGAAIGSAIPGLGTALGAGLGGLLGLFG